MHLICVVCRVWIAIRVFIKLSFCVQTIAVGSCVVACSQSSRQVPGVQCLIAHNQDCRLWSSLSCCYAGLSVLYAAVRRGSLDIVAVLICTGHAQDACQMQPAFTPLHLGACQSACGPTAIAVQGWLLCRCCFIAYSQVREACLRLRESATCHAQGVLYVVVMLGTLCSANARRCTA